MVPLQRFKGSPHEWLLQTTARKLILGHICVIECPTGFQRQRTCIILHHHVSLDEEQLNSLKRPKDFPKQLVHQDDVGPSHTNNHFK